MIHQVAIKSLPQEWLWCETWCDDGSKKHAKTIDLVNDLLHCNLEFLNPSLSVFKIILIFQCNNPMTKEAKLQAAMRILPEWVGYDEEIKALQQRIENESRQSDREEVGKENAKPIFKI